MRNTSKERNSGRDCSIGPHYSFNFQGCSEVLWVGHAMADDSAFQSHYWLILLQCCLDFITDNQCLGTRDLRASLDSFAELQMCNRQKLAGSVRCRRFDRKAWRLVLSSRCYSY